jgi:hypothetical protein
MEECPADVYAEAVNTAVTMELAIQANLGGIGREWEQAACILLDLCHSQCRGSSCLCLDLQARLQQLLAKAAQQRPEIGDLIKLSVPTVLLDYTIQIPACQHAVAARLAVAEAYYK